MAMSSLGLGFIFGAKDMASAKINTVSRSLNVLSTTSETTSKKYTAAMASIKSGAIALAAGAVGLMALNRASKTFESFEKALVSAGTIMGATSNELLELKKAAIQAGIETQFSPEQAVQGLENLGAAGLNAADAIKVLNPVLGLAAASLGQLGVAESAQVVVGAMNAFGETTEMAATRVDQLVRITQKSSFQARDFNVALSQASAQAKSADQSFESMVATLGLLRNTSLDASSAATSYREAVRRVSGDERAQRMLRKLNVEVMDEQTGKIKDLSAVIAEMQPALQKLNAKERNLNLTKIFGVRGQKAYNAVMAGYEKLLKEGKVKAGDFAAAHRIMVGELKNSAGAASAAEEAFKKTAAGQRVLLEGSIQTFKTLAGENITKTLVPVLKQLISIVNSAIKVLNKLDPTMKSMIAEFLLFGSAALVLVGTLKILKGVMGLMSLSGAAGGVVAGAAGSTAALNDTTAAATRQTKASTRLARVNASLGRGFAKFGAALPLIGVAVAGLGAAYRALTADSRALKDSQLSRAKQEQILTERMAKLHFANKEAALKAGAVAEAQAAKLASGSTKNAATASKNLLTIENRIARAFATSDAAAKKMAAARQKLATSSDPETRRFFANQEMQSEKAFLTAQKIIQANKFAALRIRGIQAERQLRFEKDHAKREQLRKIAIAGRVAEARRIRALIILEKEKAKAIPEGLKSSRAAAKASIDLLKKQRRAVLDRAGGLAGVKKGTRSLGDLKRITAAAGADPLAKTVSFGKEREGFLGALSAGGGAVPEGLDQGGLQRFRSMVLETQGTKQAGGDFTVGAKTADLIRKIDSLISDQKRRENQEAALRKRGRMQSGSPVHVNVVVDSEAIATAVASADQDDNEAQGANGPGGAA